MSKTVVGLLAGGAATVVVGAGGFLAYNQLSQPNTSNVSVQQANTNTAPAVKNNLLGTWIGVDDPAIKVTFTEDEITVHEKGEAKGNYKLLCGSQVVEITNGDLANNLMKMTIQGGVLTLEALDRRLKFRREPGDGSRVTDTIVQPYTPVKNDLPGTWTESVADGNDEPLKYTFTTDKMTESSGKSSNYKFLCEGVIETDYGNDRIVVGKVDIVGDELTLVGRGKLFKLKRESSSVDYTKFKELKSLSGHASFVRSVAFSPDGKTLASGSDDATIKLWNVEDGKEIRSLAGHRGRVTSFAFSPDGKMLASGSESDTIRVWNVEDGTQIRSFSVDSPALAVAFSPDGKTLAGASNPLDNFCSVKLWNVEDGKEIRALSGHTAYVASVAFSPDGKTLVSGSYDRLIMLWNVEDGKWIRSFLPQDRVTSVAFSPDGKTLAGETEKGTIKLWNVEDGKEIRFISGHAYGVNSVAFSPDGKTLASGTDAGTIKLSNVEDGKEIQSLSGHTKVGVWVVAFSPDGKTLASGAMDMTVKLWRAE